MTLTNNTEPMGYMKNSAAFQVAMDEARRDDDLLDQRYAEELYKNRLKGLIPPAEKVSSQDKEPKQVTPPQNHVE